MDNNKGAIEWLQGQINNHRLCLESAKCRRDECSAIKHEIAVHALEKSIEALEKQVPKNPIIKAWEPALCPSCGAELSEHKGDGYYSHYYGKEICECGQKIDWGE